MEPATTGGRFRSELPWVEKDEHCPEINVRFWPGVVAKFEVNAAAEVTYGPAAGARNGVACNVLAFKAEDCTLEVLLFNWSSST